MEVDLLCADSRVVIELDGAQHLADPVAYQRDRRKDQLLQENGYLVLRFLAEDVAKEPDTILDTILRSLAVRGSDSRAAGGCVAGGRRHRHFRGDLPTASLIARIDKNMGVGAGRASDRPSTASTATDPHFA